MVKITKNGKNKAWVTFTLTGEGIESAAISGTWNDWKSEEMKKKKNGDFYIRKSLETGKSYEFGYTVNGDEWQCDDDLGCVASPFGSDNSLLEL